VHQLKKLREIIIANYRFNGNKLASRYCLDYQKLKANC
jgi:hypothetical protein